MYVRLYLNLAQSILPHARAPVSDHFGQELGPVEMRFWVRKSELIPI